MLLSPRNKRCIVNESLLVALVGVAGGLSFVDQCETTSKHGLVITIRLDVYYIVIQMNFKKDNKENIVIRGKLLASP